MGMIVPAVALSFLLIVSWLARRRQPRIRLAIDTAALIATSFLLWRVGQGPLLLSVKPSLDAVDLWPRALAFCWWLFASRAAASAVRAVLGHDLRSRESRLLSDLLAAAIHLAAALIVLDLVFRLPIGGLVATSGLVAIVVGLALQNTLADVFAGIAVGIERPFGVDDRIALSDGTEGTVEQINWRSIRLRTDQDDLAVIPNSTIAKAQIVNRSVPAERGMVRADLPVAAAVDPDQVLELLRWSAMLVPEVLVEPPAVPLLTRLGGRQNRYAILATVADTRKAARVRSELLRRTRRQLDASGLLLGVPPASGGRLLRTAILFESLGDDQVAMLEEALVYSRLAAGDVLFAQGDGEPILHLVASGVVEITRSSGAQSHTLGRIGSGDYIGEIGLLTGAPHPVTATALTEVGVYRLNKAALEPLIVANEDLLHAFDRSVRRGQELLRHHPAMSRPVDIAGTGELLARIRLFFHASTRRGGSSA